MSLEELIKFAESNEVPLSTVICFDRGIDLIEEAERAVFNGVEIVLYPKDREDVGV